MVFSTSIGSLACNIISDRPGSILFNHAGFPHCPGKREMSVNLKTGAPGLEKSGKVRELVWKRGGKSNNQNGGLSTVY
jgi:hypothetical protein